MKIIDSQFLLMTALYTALVAKFAQFKWSDCVVKQTIAQLIRQCALGGALYQNLDNIYATNTLIAQYVCQYCPYKRLLPRLHVLDKELSL